MSVLAAALALAAQWPRDAREVAAWHAAHVAGDAASAPRAEEWRERLFVYQAAGAEAEAWAASAALARLAPGDPDGERYTVQIAAWEPDRWADGLALAASWLTRHPERDAAERDGVARAHALLEARMTARRAAAERRVSRAWVPWAALAVCAAGAAFALRRPR